MIPVARALFRFIHFLGTSLRALFDFVVCVRGRDLHARAQWSHRWGSIFKNVLGVQLDCRGVPPRHGLLACNHLSYLDIVILSSVRPQVFLSKAQVRNWPMIGTLARCSGALFINRQRRHDVCDLQSSFRAILGDGLSITFFPEGTTSNGSTVLPFYSSLLEPVISSGCPVTPAYISYQIDDGETQDMICYYGDMTFLSHFLRLLGKKRIMATVVFGEPMPTFTNRKELSLALRQAVIGLGLQSQVPSHASSGGGRANDGSNLDLLHDG
jgi:lyso-ornithine lipid O-acyltransferase